MKQVFLTQKGPAAVGPYSTCAMTADTAYISGMIALDPKTGALVAGGIEEQTVQVLENIKIVMEEMGLTMAHTLKTTVFLTDLDNFGAVNAIYARYFGPDFPARSCFEVSRLPKGAMVEIEVIAARNIG